MFSPQPAQGKPFATQREQWLAEQRAATENGLPAAAKQRFQLNHGLAFERLSNGDVAITQDHVATQLVIDRGTWISLVLAMTATMERPCDWGAFMAHHLGDRDLTEADQVMQVINRLRADEGASVTILCPNPEGDPNQAVDVFDTWTGYSFQRFEGDTLLQALGRAEEAKREAERLAKQTDQSHTAGPA